MTIIISKKYCIGCEINRNVAFFYKDKRAKDGLYTRCKMCHGKYLEAYSKTPEGIESNRRKQKAFKERFLGAQKSLT